ncbi:male-specific lethal 1-like 1 [Myxocyprinus asiaticus]|uniref:male-specific lethal 1-like 1 n=1 Tax=Myxocyprinus asiaticus TaxID=70543 RepID=UPI0022224D81|nr:male-specific lethal 1-like 1 [Myxocyprinus asiaticus]XP_051571080.1 male-specific lethal 1-like 1 [Myxocyprinus asiaticus]
MTMRSTVFTSGAHRLDASLIELSKKQAGAHESPAGLKKESREFTTHVLSTIHNSAHHHHHPNSIAKTSCQSLLCSPDQSPAGECIGQEENWEKLESLTLPSAKQMGAEGFPVKSKSLFCQASHNHVGKMDPMVSNGSNQRRDGGPVGGVAVTGVPSPENSPDGKRRNVRKGPSLVDTQTSCIRQILLLQLELIEQQQKQLHTKSKEIDDLKAEKEMLMARIERMERRLQMVRKDGGESRPSQTPRRREPEAESTASDEVQHAEGQVNTLKQMHYGRGGKCLKRRFLFQDSQMGRARRGQPKSPLPQKGPSLKEECQEEMGPELQSQSEELPYLATTEMYLCRWHQPPPSPWRDSSPVHEDTVAVPSWRKSIIEPLDQKDVSDIPESLDDNVFLKRHAKLELDEKRRKRWDIQRIREQRMFQRLQQRMNNRRKVIAESEPELHSFYPDPEDVESIMMTPFLPVVAFGRPLPNLKQQNFDLPWLDERSRCRTEVTKKKTPHRTCRK